MKLDMRMRDIDDRLTAWARWVGAGKPLLGYSDRTLIYEMVRSGIIAHGSGLKPEPEAEEEQRTEAGMQKLKEAHQKEHLAVALQYAGKGQQWQKAKDMDISEDSFKKLLRAGKWWLEGYFEAL